MGITRPRPDGGVKKKTGITRPRPDGGVKTGITRPRPDGGVKMGITKPRPDGRVIKKRVLRVISKSMSWKIETFSQELKTKYTS